MKHNAEIPTELAKLLDKTIGSLIERSTRQTKYRGRKVTAPNEREIYVWDRLELREDFYSYKINRNNCFISSVLEQLDDNQKNAVELMLQQIESNIPIHQMHLDHDVNKIDRTNDEDKLNDLCEQAVMVIEWYVFKGTPLMEAYKDVMACEQFRNNHDLDKLIRKKYSL